MKKQEVAEKMYWFDKAKKKASQKGKESLEIAKPSKGKNLRATGMIAEKNEANRP